MGAQAPAEGPSELLNRPDNAVIACLMGSEVMEDAAMFISGRTVTVIGPGGWRVTVKGSKPATARIDARDAAGRTNAALRKAFRAALDDCR